MPIFEGSAHANKLNDLQISLLRLFSQKISDAQTLEIRRLLMDYFDAQLKTELEKVIEQKGFTDEDYRQMLYAKS